MVKIVDGRVRTENLIDSILPATARGRAKMANTFVVTAKVDEGDITTPLLAELAATESKIGTTAIVTGKIRDGHVIDGKLNSLFQMASLTTVPETGIWVTFPTGYQDTPVVIAVPGPGNNYARVISVNPTAFNWLGQAGPPPGTASWLAWGHRP